MASSQTTQAPKTERTSEEKDEYIAQLEAEVQRLAALNNWYLNWRNSLAFMMNSRPPGS